MKKIIPAAIVAATAVVIATSCQKKEAEISEIYKETPSVTVTFSDSDHTKAFFDNTATAETFEKGLSSLSILVFDEDENLIVRRNFTESEIQAKSCSFRLPKTVAGSNCLFYGIANFSTDDVKTLEELLELMESEVQNYNGTFSEVTSAAKRTGGFVMSGKKTQEVAESGTTNVSIALKRTVAKIAIQTSISEDFGTLYGGKITVLSATVGNGAEKTSVISTDFDNDSDCEYSHTQEVGTSDGKFNSLFYLYENSYCENYKAVTVSLAVLYDLDGDYSTTGDQREFTYDFEVNGIGDGELVRNGYYRIAATIKAPEGSGCEVSVSVADWETPITQNVDLGV